MSLKGPKFLTESWFNIVFTKFEKNSFEFNLKNRNRFSLYELKLLVEYQKFKIPVFAKILGSRYLN
jgi:hypothetical protein